MLLIIAKGTNELINTCLCTFDYVTIAFHSLIAINSSSMEPFATPARTRTHLQISSCIDEAGGMFENHKNHPELNFAKEISKNIS